MLSNGASPAAFVAAAAFVAGLSGVPGIIFRGSRNFTHLFSTVAIAAASVAGITGALLSLGAPPSTCIIGPGTGVARIEVGLDALSAIFLLPIFIVSACCSVFSLRYWPAKEKAGAPFTQLCIGLLVASMSMVVTARSGFIFLIAWEVMALSAFFALSAEHELPEVQESGKLYLVTTHAGTLALFGVFSLLGSSSGSFGFPSADSLPAGTPAAAAVFLAALFGFGLKAGMMPLHIWLPGAHASAPSHVSALMSGVIIKMGIYGIVRTVSFYADIPGWWGGTLAAAGIISAIGGVVYAIGQHDLKRLLAYHSIENIGIIILGVGTALLGKTYGMSFLVLLGMGGALLHVINHALFKSLLFLCAGSVVHATGTRKIDLMGGLGRRMPKTSFFFLVGAVAICGLPPLNGFVSEFLLYVGFFRGLSAQNNAVAATAALAAPALALVGGLALLCFVKVYGAVFLGFPRTAKAAESHECPRQMLLPMALLALLCGVIGFFPAITTITLKPAIEAWAPGMRQVTAATEWPPLIWLTVAAVLLGIICGGIWFIISHRSASAATAVTWDCGYLRPAPSMQYTASSFAQMIVQLFGGLLRPHRNYPKIKSLFPENSRFSSHVPEAVLELAVLPASGWINRRLAFVRYLQHGQLPLYILYIFVTLLCLLAWGAFVA